MTMRGSGVVSLLMASSMLVTTGEAYPAWLRYLGKRMDMSSAVNSTLPECKYAYWPTSVVGNTLRIFGMDPKILRKEYTMTEVNPNGTTPNEFFLLFWGKADLTKSFDITEGSSFMDMTPSKFLQNQEYSNTLVYSDVALWSNKQQEKVYMFGGRTSSAARRETAEINYFDVKNESWYSRSTESVYNPPRLAYGAHADAPEIQAGFWVGGYRSNLTTVEIFDDTNIYAKGLLIFNSTTLQTRNLTDVPFGATQYGALHYLSSSVSMGALVYLGGERPKNTITSLHASNYEYEVTTLDKVWVFDVANEVWYLQETTGDIPPPRTEFCSVKMADTSRNGTYQIYIMGGADFKTKEMQSDVYALDVPSFRWYKTGRMTSSLMSMSCVVWGREVMMLGGRPKFAEMDANACIKMELGTIWDLGSQKEVTTHDPTASAYIAPTVITRASPTPVKWSDPSLSSVFLRQSTTVTAPSQLATEESKMSTPTALITGASVGGFIGILLCIGIFFFYRRRLKQKIAVRLSKMDHTKDPTFGIGAKAELPPEGAREDNFPLRPEISGGKEGFIWTTHAELCPEGGREGNFPLRPELAGRSFRPEMYGSQTSPVELPADLPSTLDLCGGDKLSSEWMGRAKTIAEACEKKEKLPQIPRKNLVPRRIPVPDRAKPKAGKGEEHNETVRY